MRMVLGVLLGIMIGHLPADIRFWCAMNDFNAAAARWQDANARDDRSAEFAAIRDEQRAIQIMDATCP